MHWRMGLAIVLLGGGVMTPGGGIGTGDISKDDFPQIPTQSPHVIERACTTRAGYCRVANQLPPGQPCYCVISTGVRVDGYVIASRWTDAR